MRRFQSLLTLAAFGLALSAGSASAVASTLEVSSVSRYVVAGHRAHLTVALRRPTARCQLIAYARYGAAFEAFAHFAIRPMRTHIEWLWRVSARARSASWRLRVACGERHASVLLTVHGHRTGIETFARYTRMVEFGRAFSFRGRRTSPWLTSALAQTRARQWWATQRVTILSDFNSGSSLGQCTAYAASRRPDIIARVDVWAYTKYLLSGGRGPLVVDWDAWHWARSAEQAGLPVGNTPQTGAVIVFQAGSYGAFSAGHVAVVDRVGQDASFTISEMHAPRPNQLTSRHFDARTAQAMASDARILFIYR